MKLLQVRVKFDPIAVSLKDINDALIKVGVKASDIEWSRAREPKEKA